MNRHYNNDHLQKNDVIFSWSPQHNEDFCNHSLVQLITLDLQHRITSWSSHIFPFYSDSLPQLKKFDSVQSLIMRRSLLASSGDTLAPYNEKSKMTRNTLIRGELPSQKDCTTHEAPQSHRKYLLNHAFVIFATLKMIPGSIGEVA